MGWGIFLKPNKSGCPHIHFIPVVFELFEGFLCLVRALFESRISIPPHQDPGRSAGAPAMGLGTSGAKSKLLCKGLQKRGRREVPFTLCVCVHKCTEVEFGLKWPMLWPMLWPCCGPCCGPRCVLSVRCYLLLGILLSRISSPYLGCLFQISSTLEIFFMFLTNIC